MGGKEGDACVWAEPRPGAGSQGPREVTYDGGRWLSRASQQSLVGVGQEAIGGPTEKGHHLACISERALETVWQFLTGLNMKLPCDPAILLLGMCLLEMKCHVCANPCTRVFPAASSRIAKDWEQYKNPSTDKGINKMGIHPDGGILVGQEKEGGADTRCDMEKP